MRSHKSNILIAMTTLAIALTSATAARAAVIKQIVDFVTPSSGSQNQLALAGKLNTLSPALGVVDYGTATVNVSGLLRAELELEVSDQGEIQVLGFELLSSNFTQSGVNLVYDVPNTSRQVTFSATGLQFGMQLAGGTNNQQLLMAGSALPSNAYQMVQNAGTAQVGVTNRPSVTQNLSQQSVLSTYPSNQPTGQASFEILPPPAGSEDQQIALSLPLSHQQMHYAGVGLPVTLSYSGTLSLIGALPLVNNQIPEPGTLALVGGALLALTLKRPRIAVRGT